jgi:hypothetical protein
MRDSEESEPPEPRETRTQLQKAYLIRCLGSGRRHYFILEDVATRKRQRFDSLKALLAHLKEILPSE